MIDQRDVEQHNDEIDRHGAFHKPVGRSLVTLVAQQVQLNNLQLCRGVKYRLATPAFLFQRIVAIPDLWPAETFNGTATNCDRQAGTQG
jgi:hypothetical protein